MTNHPSGGPECLFSGTVPMMVRTGTAPSVPSVGSLLGGLASAASTSPSSVATDTILEGGRRVDSIVVEVYLGPPYSLGSSKRILEIRLTDSQDPLFMWQASLSEDEYFVMRRDQNLLVDFGHFPFRLCEFLQQCIAHSREERPAFSAFLTIFGEDCSDRSRQQQYAQLSIGELTSFRQISHLTIKLAAVNEATLRKYLAEQVKRYRQELGQWAAGGGSSRPDPFTTANTRMASSQPQQQAPFIPPAFDTFNIAERLRILTERCNLLESQNNQLQMTKTSQDNEIALLKGQLHTAYEESRRLRNELLGISSSNNHAGGGNVNQPNIPSNAAPPSPPIASSRIVGGLNAQIAGLEALVKEKNNEIGRINDLYESAREGKRQAEDTLAQLRTQIGQLEASNRQYTADIAKANDIIRKLQEELRSAKSRMRTAESLVKQHERIAQDTTTSYDAARTEVRELREQLAQRNKELGDLAAAKHALETELDEAKKLVEGHEKVIAWMHKEINESHLDRIVSKAKVEEQLQNTVMNTNNNNGIFQFHRTNYSPPPPSLQAQQKSSNPSIPTMPMRLSPEELAGKAKYTSTFNIQQDSSVPQGDERV